MKRFLSLLTLIALVCAWLPSAFSEAEGEAWRWSLSFDVKREGETAADRALLELLDAFGAEGTFSYSHGAFTLEGSFWLDSAKRSRTSFRLYGREDRWILETPLLGDVALMFNNPAMVEYGNKLYNHLDLPVHWLTLLYPYVWKDALQGPLAAWEAYVTIPAGDGVIENADLIDFAKRVAELSQSDRAFRNLVYAVFAGTEDEDLLRDLPRLVADWLDAVAPDGIRVTLGQEGETWQAGNQTIYSRSADGSSTAIVIPNPVSGEFASFRDETDGEGIRTLRFRVGRDVTQADIEILIKPDPYGVVRLSVSGELTQSLPALAFHTGEQGSLHLSTIREEGGSATLHLSHTSNGWELHTNPLVSSADMLIRFTAEPYTPDAWPAWQIEELNGVNFYSLDDASLRTLIDQVKLPLLHGGAKLIAEAPADTVVFLMDWVDEHFLSELTDLND